ncbi:hypothetical protein O181_037100 [Austropuccinia psidii MF-1]|uniref:Uncharacterized protein n=1 Tax=Austropuccinia psidii MF-1 TaxID=1389203 RepID=A0A9Q3D7M6_9BASI|nr:hypothetical protein [Austropuccinia psidii MF-1]
MLISRYFARIEVNPNLYKYGPSHRLRIRKPVFPSGTPRGALPIGYGKGLLYALDPAAVCIGTMLLRPHPATLSLPNCLPSLIEAEGPLSDPTLFRKAV